MTTLLLPWPAPPITTHRDRLDAQVDADVVELRDEVVAPGAVGEPAHEPTDLGRAGERGGAGAEDGGGQGLGDRVTGARLACWLRCASRSCHLSFVTTGPPSWYAPGREPVRRAYRLVGPEAGSRGVDRGAPGPAACSSRGRSAGSPSAITTGSGCP